MLKTVITYSSARLSHRLNCVRPRTLLLLAGVALCTLSGLAGLGCAGGAAADEETHGSVGPALNDIKAVKVLTKREGEVTHFYVQNDEYSEITMTFVMSLAHLKSSAGQPFTATFPARQTTEAFTLTPEEAGAKWEYSYTNFFKLGSNCAQHDDSYVYQLPYGPGEKFKVTQGYNGKYSHKGSNQYATDWEMPEGTLVHAARGGIVVKVKDDSDKGGGSMEFDRYNNYVLIRHDDGTLGHYCHLQKGGIVVKAGQSVATGEIIAHSGNTGFSSGPHLHFCVFKTKNGRERVSLPVKFRTANDKAITLVSGRNYRAAEMQTASAHSAMAAGQPQGSLVR